MRPAIADLQTLANEMNSLARSIDTDVVSNDNPLTAEETLALENAIYRAKTAAAIARNAYTHVSPIRH